jgi:hypothetical protein
MTDILSISASGDISNLSSMGDKFFEFAQFHCRTHVLLYQRKRHRSWHITDNYDLPPETLSTCFGYVSIKAVFMNI